MTGIWYQHEEKDRSEILQKFWQKIFIKKEGNGKGFKNYILHNHLPKGDSEFEQKINKLFDQAEQGKIEFKDFAQGLASVPFSQIRVMSVMEGVGKLGPPPDHREVPNLTITSDDLANLKQYLLDMDLSAVISFANAKDRQLTILSSSQNKASDVFSMHSVGKVFTGMLIYKMLEAGVITEVDLLKPIQLAPEVFATLPPNVQQHLQKPEVTLLKLMTHKGGLGDFRENFRKYIEECLKKGEKPRVTHMRELTQFVESNTFALDQPHYSNAAILLIGFAIEHAYENKFNEHRDFIDILKDYILQPAGIPFVNEMKPKDSPKHQAKFNQEDRVWVFDVGSSAGGYWLTAEDLTKFGQWIYDQYHSDPKKPDFVNPCFADFIRKGYGEEFFADKQNPLLAVHSGGNGFSSSFFAVSLHNGTILAILSDQAAASNILQTRIAYEIFYKDSPVQKLDSTAHVLGELNIAGGVAGNPAVKEVAQKTAKRVEVSAETKVATERPVVPPVQIEEGEQLPTQGRGAKS